MPKIDFSTGRIPTWMDPSAYGALKAQNDEEERRKQALEALAKFQAPETVTVAEQRPMQEDSGATVSPDLISALNALGGTQFSGMEPTGGEKQISTPREFSLDRAASELAPYLDNPTVQQFIKMNMLAQDEKRGQQAVTKAQNEGLELLPEMTGPLQKVYKKALETGDTDRMKEIEKTLYDTGGEGGSSVFAMKYKMYATPENQAKNEESISALENANKISAEDAQILRNSNTGVGIYETMMKLAGIASGVTTKVRGAEEVIPAHARDTAATTAARENMMRGIQKDNPILSDAQSEALTDSYMAINYLNRLKSDLKSGNIDYFDVDRRTGQFKHPRVADAYGQLVEIVGRKRSGAAISKSEWTNFGKEILNKNFLLTKEGKQQAESQIEDYLDRYYSAGVNVAGDDGWYNKVKNRGKAAREKAEGPTADGHGKRRMVYNPETKQFEAR